MRPPRDVEAQQSVAVGRALPTIQQVDTQRRPHRQPQSGGEVAVAIAPSTAAAAMRQNDEAVRRPGAGRNAEVTRHVGRGARLDGRDPHRTLVTGRERRGLAGVRGRQTPQQSAHPSITHRVVVVVPVGDRPELRRRRSASTASKSAATSRTPSFDATGTAAMRWAGRCRRSARAAALSVAPLAIPSSTTMTVHPASRRTGRPSRYRWMRRSTSVRSYASPDAVTLRGSPM